MVKNPHANAGGTGSIPGAAEQLSPCATTTEDYLPQLVKTERLERVLHNKRRHCSEKSVCCN